MKTQTSLEFTVYLAVSVVSLVLSLSFFMPYYLKIEKANDASQYAVFIASVNSAMDYYSSSFLTMIPNGLCNSTISGGIISGPYGQFRLNGDLRVSNSLCIDSGKSEMLSMVRQPDGGFLVS